MARTKQRTSQTSQHRKRSCRRKRKFDYSGGDRVWEIIKTIVQEDDTTTKCGKYGAKMTIDDVNKTATIELDGAVISVIDTVKGTASFNMKNPSKRVAHSMLYGLQLIQGGKYGNYNISRKKWNWNLTQYDVNSDISIHCFGKEKIGQHNEHGQHNEYVYENELTSRPKVVLVYR